MKKVNSACNQSVVTSVVADVHEQPIFSIIVPVFNAEDNLESCLESILSQSFGKDDLQLILINDGSTDSSKEICTRFAREYPNIVLYVEQSNKGVSAARNKGLDLSEGKYVGFVDADDEISSDVLLKVNKFFSNCSKKVHVVTVPVQNIGTKNTAHYLNGKFSGGTRVISLDRPKWSDVSTRVAQAFFLGEVARSYRFDEKITYFEDTKYINEILSETMLLGVVCGANYFYRRFEKGCDKQNVSLTNSAEEKREFYIDTPRDVSLAMLLRNKDDKGQVPKYFQFVALCEMRWRTFYNYAEESSVLDANELDEYKSLCREILSFIEDETIIECNLLNGWQKTYLLSIKHSRDINNELEYDETGELLWGQHVLFDAVKQLRIDLVDISVLDGIACINVVIIGYVKEGVRILANVNGQRLELSSSDDLSEVSKYGVLEKTLEYKRSIYGICVELKDSITTVRFEYEIKERTYKVKRIGISSIKNIDALRPVIKKEERFYIRRFRDHISLYRSSIPNMARVFLSMGKRYVRNGLRKVSKTIRGQ